MANSINLEDVDAHIRTLQSQITFLAQWLDSMHSDTEASSGNSNSNSTISRNSDWLASEVISIKGATSMLYDKWRYLRKRTVAEGLVNAGNESGSRSGTEKEKDREKEKRLSIEGVKSLHIHSRNVSRSGTPLASETSHKRKSIGNGESECTGSGLGLGRESKREKGALTPAVVKAHPTASNDPEDGDGNDDGTQGADYQVQYIDISSAVHQRLRETRLRSLQDTTPTSQKRKRDALDAPAPHPSTHSNNLEGQKAGEGEEDPEDALAALMSPPKKIKTIGGFEPSGLAPAPLAETLNAAQGHAQAQARGQALGQEQAQAQAQSTVRKRVFSTSASGAEAGAGPLENANAAGQGEAGASAAGEEETGGRTRAKRRRM